MTPVQVLASSTHSSASCQVEALPPFVRALLRPEAYPHSADDIRLHETHISWVVLAGPYAYKVKKPVDFGFLDFSTVERRADACADEVRLNRRLCPDVYLGVVDIVQRQGEYFLGGPGRPVEPAVRMRRLPEEGMLPSLLAGGAVEARLVRRIGRRLARFHATASTGPGIDEYGTAAAVEANWRENFTQIAPFVGRTLSADLAEAVRLQVESFILDRAALLERRVAEGRIRDGHGDLHAASICLEGRQLHFFDCLEFAPRFRCSDVAAEVAFLAMDLDHYGRADLAAAFVESYLRASGDAELPALLNFYKCYRAYVRGKVLSLRLTEPGLASAEETNVVNEARAYFDLAWAYVGGVPGPLLVVTMGLPASGKTSLARELARRLGLVHLSSDAVRKELAGLRPTEHRGEAFGQGLYDQSMTRRTYATLRRRAARLLRRGQSVVLDATYGRVAERTAVRLLAEKTGARLAVLVCESDEATLHARLAARESDAQTISDARLDLWPALRAAYTEPSEVPDAVSVSTSAPLPQAAEQSIAALRVLAQRDCRDSVSFSGGRA